MEKKSVSALQRCMCVCEWVHICAHIGFRREMGSRLDKTMLKKKQNSSNIEFEGGLGFVECQAAAAE